MTTVNKYKTRYVAKRFSQLIGGGGVETLMPANRVPIKSILPTGARNIRFNKKTIPNLHSSTQILTKTYKWTNRMGLEVWQKDCSMVQRN